MINIILELDELNLVLNSLGELPAKISMGVILKLQNQAKLQIPSDKEPKEDGKKESE